MELPRAEVGTLKKKYLRKREQERVSTSWVEGSLKGKGQREGEAHFVEE